ncbi:MAG: M42 family metallopeptidase, partial [Promethearchaeota archaeon]
PIGGWDERLLLGQNVIMEPQVKRIHGIIGALPPHILTPEIRKKPVQIDSLWMDFGFLSREEAEEAGVKVGTVTTLSSGFHELPGGRLMGKAFDDRSGCNILAQTAINLQDKELPYTICFAWSAQEEVGLRGATTSSYTLTEQYNIQMAVAVENTTAGDVPGVKPQRSPTKMGEGPAITIADRSMIADKKVVNRLIAVAEENNIPYQFKLPASGGTDAGRIHLTRSGIPTSVVSVPGRYIHSQSSIIDKRDLIAAVDLITAFCLYSP